MSHYKRCNHCKKVKPAEDFKVGEFVCKDCEKKVKEHKNG